jgi:2-keto-4-pentenoate hydratase/2-oxohepta-3-ene-1,7-dioic acid hydratase in catechol pathway
MTRFIRFYGPYGSRYGVVEGDHVVELCGTPLERSVAPSGQTHPLEAVRLLAPCQPSKVVLVSGNYPVVVDAFDKPERTQPWIFIKPGTAVIGPGDTIPVPPWATTMTHEPERGLVIGQTCRTGDAADAGEYILGYVCINDVMATESPDAELVVTRAKSYDGFCPLGPAIVSDVDPRGLQMRSIVDGEVKIEATTADMIFSVAEIVSHVSHSMTLLPGDVISTGAADVQPMNRGGQVTIQVDGIGDLTNPVG